MLQGIDHLKTRILSPLRSKFEQYSGAIGEIIGDSDCHEGSELFSPVLKRCLTENRVGQFFRDHHHHGIDITAGNARHDGGIHDPQPL